MKKFLLICLCAMTMLVATVPVFASENETYIYGPYAGELPFVDFENMGYESALLFKYANTSTGNTTYKMVLSNSMFEANQSYQLVFAEGGTHVVMTLSDGSNEWERSNSYSHYAHDNAMDSLGSNKNLYALCWTAHDIIDSKGSVYQQGDPNFLPVPPLEVVVKEELEKTTLPQIQGAISTLVLCGVGLMALLLGLPLLSKVLHRFLPN